MAEKIIAASLQVNTGTSNTNIKEVNKNLKDVKGSLSEAGAAGKLAGKDIEATGGSFGKLKDQMSALPGPLGAAGDGVGKLNTSFKALLANPVALVIVAIVAALALLYKAFTNTFEGGEKMEQVFAGIKAAAQALFDNLGHVASAIVKFFQFDFKGARDEIKGVAAEATKAYEAMSNLTKEAQGLAREQADNDLEQAQRQGKLADLKAKLAEGDISPAERKKAAQELLTESKKNAEEDLALADRVAKNKIAQLTLEKDGNQKNYIEIQKIKADQIRDATANSNELKQIGKQVTASEKDEIKARREAEKAAAKERQAERAKDVADAKALQKTLIEDNYLAQLDANDKLLELERRKHAQNLAILKKGNQDVFAETVRHNVVQNTLTAKLLEDSVGYTQKLNDEITASAAGGLATRKEIVLNQTTIEKEGAEARKHIATLETEHRKEQLQEVAGLLSSLADIVGKQTVAGKAIGIATALINTYQGASEAIKQKSTLPSPFDFIAKAINVAAIIAMGLKTVKAITAVQVPGGGGGGANVSAAPSISASAPIAPTQQGVQLDQGSINNVGSAVAPTRAYVLSADIEQDANRTARINRAARLEGG